MTTTTTTTAADLEQRGSDVVRALEDLWTAIRANHPELPEVVMITGTGIAKWGHTAVDRWDSDVDHASIGSDVTMHAAEHGRRTELFIAGERLATGAQLTAQTMLHEAAHVLAHTRGAKDTSRQGRYHNQTFVELAAELGLTWPEGARPHTVAGFSAVEIRPETVARYQEQIDALGAAIQLYVPLHPLIAALLGGDGAGGAAARPPRIARGTARNLSVATCRCETPRKIRIAPRTLDQAPITCGACGEDFAYRT